MVHGVLRVNACLFAPLRSNHWVYILHCMSAHGSNYYCFSPQISFHLLPFFLNDRTKTSDSCLAVSLLESAILLYVRLPSSLCMPENVPFGVDFVARVIRGIHASRFCGCCLFQGPYLGSVSVSSLSVSCFTVYSLRIASFYAFFFPVPSFSVLLVSVPPVPSLAFSFAPPFKQCQITCATELIPLPTQVPFPFSLRHRRSVWVLYPFSSLFQI